jgi:hypothetical protein
MNIKDEAEALLDSPSPDNLRNLNILIAAFIPRLDKAVNANTAWESQSTDKSQRAANARVAIAYSLRQVLLIYGLPLSRFVDTSVTEDEYKPENECEPSIEDDYRTYARALDADNSSEFIKILKIAGDLHGISYSREAWRRSISELDALR